MSGLTVPCGASRRSGPLAKPHSACADTVSCVASVVVRLTLRHRNDLFEAISRAGLDMATFDFKFRKTKAVVHHRPTRSAFRLGVLYLELSDRISAWAVPDGARSSLPDRASWADVCDSATRWATEIRYVSDTPDLWKEMRNGPAAKLLNATQNEGSNTQFTVTEQAAIAGRIEEIKEQTRKNPDLTAEQISGIEQKLDVLVDASRRVGRKDLSVMIYGAAFGMIVNDAVPAHVVQGIIAMIIHGLGHLLGLGGVPPALPPQA